MYFVCCKILGVKPGSDIETIKTAYRKAAKELHPDINPSENANQYFIILKNAYQYLLDHPYTIEEVELISRVEKARRAASEMRRNNAQVNYSNRLYERSTLSEILKQSRIARILYIVFHVLFLTIGFYLIIRPVYDVLYFPVDYRSHPVTAYLTIISAFFFGIVITSMFLYSGINFVRRR